MSRRIVSVVAGGSLVVAMAGTALAAEPSTSPGTGGAAGVTGPGLGLLTITPDVVEVVAGGAVPVEGGAQGATTNILAIVGNGTTEPVEATVAWAAAAPDGALLWAGEMGNSRSSVDGS